MSNQDVTPRSAKNSWHERLARAAVDYRNTRRRTFFCFSPPVMIATFLIEIALAGYALWRYRSLKITRLAVLTLLFLSVFQLAEFMVCGQQGGSWWARIGYVAITLLPPLGLHMAYVIAGVKKRSLLIAAYTAAAGFMAFFLMAGHGAADHACLGNYVIFDLHPVAARLFSAYYYILLAAALFECWRLAKASRKKSVRRGLAWLMVGYASFIVPTIIVYALEPQTARGIPSIMCGFAVILAFMLVFAVLPAIVQKTHAKSHVHHR